MRYLLVALSLFVGSVTSAHAQVSVSVGFPVVEIGIDVPVYPELALVPDSPVYYDPRADTNYFFYDGVYWVYRNDNWYASSWYNGPWQMVRPESVPIYVLRVPVRYYREPPPYFGRWRPDAPPRWGEHWGRGWERHHAGWDRWDRRSVPRPAPLPVYQRNYSGDRYPRAMEQQHSIGAEHYAYRPREAVVREHFQQRAYPGGPRGEPQNGNWGGPRGAEPHGNFGGPRAEPQRGNWGGPRGAEPQRGNWEGPRGAEPQRGNWGGPRGGDAQRGNWGGPRAEPPRQGPGPQQAQDGGAQRRPERRDDERGNRNEERRRGP